MSTRFRRGFKKECDEYSQEFRLEMRLRPSEPLSPWRLAEHLAVPVLPLSAHRELLPSATERLLNQDRRAFSAVALLDGTHRSILYNDGHAPVRQASDIAHELAHVVLGHPPMLLFSDRGSRSYNPELEAEAEWLGPALLVSREAAMYIVRRGMTTEAAAAHYEVSVPVMRMRLNVTGVRKILSRSRAA